MTPQQKIGNELLAFFQVAQLGTRIWLDGIKMRIYVRMEGGQCRDLENRETWSSSYGPRLNIASVEYFEPEDWERFAKKWFIDFCEFAHDHNPWQFTFLESFLGFNMHEKYRGIDYPFPAWGWFLKLWRRFMCKREMHLWSECLSSAGGKGTVNAPWHHYLCCDACQLIVNIESIDDQYVKK